MCYFRVNNGNRSSRRAASHVSRTQSFLQLYERSECLQGVLSNAVGSDTSAEGTLYSKSPHDQLLEDEQKLSAYASRVSSLESCGRCSIDGRPVAVSRSSLDTMSEPRVSPAVSANSEVHLQMPDVRTLIAPDHAYAEAPGVIQYCEMLLRIH